eukprot:3901917-Rhodomonas_salina.1
MEVDYSTIRDVSPGHRSSGGVASNHDAVRSQRGRRKIESRGGGSARYGMGIARYGMGIARY